MMIAQIPGSENAIMLGAAGIVGLFLTHLTGMFQVWIRDRRERDDSKRRDGYLLDIAQTNREAMKSLHDVSDNQIKASDRVVSAEILATTRHDQLVRALDKLPHGVRRFPPPQCPIAPNK